jgi:hypothetical protein
LPDRADGPAVTGRAADLWRATKGPSAPAAGRAGRIVSGRGERNQRNAVVVSADDSRTAVLVVPTDEELEIAQQSRAVLGLV